jgi:hypothetical protein
MDIIQITNDVTIINGNALLVVTNLLVLLTFIVSGWFAEWRIKKNKNT